MQKKIIFTVVLLSFLAGMGGGMMGVYWFNDDDYLTNDSVVVQGGGGEEDSPLIVARQAVSPAVISIVQYVDEAPSGELAFYGDFTTRAREVGGGTGFIVDPSGLAITNKHVVPNDDSHYVAILDDGTRFDMTVLARDASNDVALVRLGAPEGSYGAELLGLLPYVTLGDSSQLRVGEPVLAIGNALAEYANTTTAGIISAIGRKVVASDGLGKVSNLSGLIQTDAAINFGNSGGPLVNLKGQVVAINTALDSEAQGIGFAIPIDDVKPALESYRLHGEIVRPVLGVSYFLLTASSARELGLPITQGAFLFSDLITHIPAVSLGSPADIAGLMEEDVIRAVDGVRVDIDHPLQDLIGHRQVGDVVTLLIWRNGKEFEVNVELTNR